MSNNNSREQELFEGLKALSDSAFPKECATCGRVYRSPQDFVQQSADIAGRSGHKRVFVNTTLKGLSRYAISNHRSAKARLETADHQKMPSSKPFDRFEIEKSPRPFYTASTLKVRGVRRSSAAYCCDWLCGFIGRTDPEQWIVCDFPKIAVRV